MSDTQNKSEKPKPMNFRYAKSFDPESQRLRTTTPRAWMEKTGPTIAILSGFIVQNVLPIFFLEAFEQMKLM